MSSMDAINPMPALFITSMSTFSDSPVHSYWFNRYVICVTSTWVDSLLPKQYLSVNIHIYAPWGASICVSNSLPPNTGIYTWHVIILVLIQWKFIQNEILTTIALCCIFCKLLEFKVNMQDKKNNSINLCRIAWNCALEMSLLLSVTEHRIRSIW